MNSDLLNSMAYEKNNDILFNVVEQLEGIVNNLEQNQIDVVIRQIKNIIIIMNKVIGENKKNMELLRKELKEINNSIKSNFEKFHCVGKKIYEDGEYVGELKNGLRDGKGAFYYYENNKYERKIYEGDWKNDKIEGKGKMIWLNGTMYEGDWKNNLKDGIGIHYYADGTKLYEGNFKNSKFEGKGVYYYEDGKRYEGDWKDHKREGSGIMYFKLGGKAMGDYLNDETIGKHGFLQPNGEVTIEIAK